MTGMMLVFLLCAVYLLSKEGAILTENEANSIKGVIVIDSGHGGNDPGVVGIGNLEEKGVNLKIAKYLAKDLQKKAMQSFLPEKVIRVFMMMKVKTRKCRICRSDVRLSKRQNRF